jgi:hypothetical protein
MKMEFTIYFHSTSSLRELCCISIHPYAFIARFFFEEKVNFIGRNIGWGCLKTGY